MTQFMLRKSVTTRAIRSKLLSISAAVLITALLFGAVPAVHATDSCTLAVTASGNTQAIGEISSSQRRVAQQFKINSSGVVTEFRVTLAGNVGSPTNPMYWQLKGGLTGTALASGSFTPVPSVENVVLVTSGPTLSAGNTYYLIFYVDDQASGNRFTVQRSNAVSVYADGELWQSSNGGSSWSVVGSGVDIQFSVMVSGLCSTPTPTAFSSSTPTSTPTSTATPTSEFLILATLPTQFNNYPVAIRANASMDGVIGFGSGFVIAGLLFLLLLVKVIWDRNVSISSD